MSSSEFEKLKDLIAGPSHWVHIEKFRVQTMMELWLAAIDAAKYAPGTPQHQRALNEVRRVVVKLG